MPSPRRVRLLALAAALALVFILFYTRGFDAGHDAASQGSTFYDKTERAMKKGGSAGQEPLGGQDKAQPIPGDKDADGDVDEDDKAHTEQMQERLKVAEKQAKEKANEKAPLRPDPPSNVIGVGSSAGGQKNKEKEKEKEGGDKVAAGTNDKGAVEKKPEPPAAAEKKDDPQTAEKLSAKDELNSILKKAPVIIFSKSYCPFSKRAKGILLEKYYITPEPHVVELDEHPLGQALQDQLLETTGRRTVPNVMVNGVSIGGADDIVELDNGDRLVGKIVGLGNKRVEVKERIGDGFSGK